MVAFMIVIISMCVGSRGGLDIYDRGEEEEQVSRSHHHDSSAFFVCMLYVLVLVMFASL